MQGLLCFIEKSNNKGEGTGKFMKKQDEKNKKCDWPVAAVAKFLIPDWGCSGLWDKVVVLARKPM